MTRFLPATWCLVFAACTVDVDMAPPEDDPGDGSLDAANSDDTTDDTGVTADVVGLSGCTQITTVILYSEATNELTLPNAFAANQDPCTRYYVHLPALSGDKTMPRGGADKVHLLGPNFHAMAEFSWGAWRDWISQSPGTRDWYIAGRAFRDRMVQAGYDVAAGDTWAINEFPTTTRTGELDVWTHEINAVKGLYEGDGTHSRGTAYLAGMGQGLDYFPVYKQSVEGWLQQDSWWQAMGAYVRWFSYEVYADPHDNCVIGSNVQKDMENLNDYLEHIPKLAKAGGARTATAANYLEHHYVPLVNEAWNSNVGFGDNLIGIDDFTRFSRLQVYSTHVYAANHGYPGRRIGFAWAPKDATPDQQTSLANIISLSVERAYPYSGFYNLGKYACSVDGTLDGCGCTVSGSYNTGWNTFENW